MFMASQIRQLGVEPRTGVRAMLHVHGYDVTAHLKDMNCHEANSVEGGVDVDVDDQLTSLESECRGEGPLSEDCSESSPVCGCRGPGAGRRREAELR